MKINKPLTPSPKANNPFAGMSSQEFLKSIKRLIKPACLSEAEKTQLLKAFEANDRNKLGELLERLLANHHHPS